MSTTNEGLSVLFFLVGAFAAFLIALWLGSRVKIFLNERKLIDREIMRSHGELRDHYKKKKRETWKIFFPFMNYRFI